MIVLIDAYNILKQRVPGIQISEFDRKQFIKKLSFYAEQRGLALIVLFDGGSCSRPTRESHDVLTIIYSGYHESADDIIKRLLVQYQHYELLLVSSDRALCQYAGEYQVPSIDSHDFYTQLLQCNKREKITSKKQPAHKRAGHLSDQELDLMMSEATICMLYKQEDDQEVVPLRNKKLSKQEKKLQRIVRKL